MPNTNQVIQENNNNNWYVLQAVHGRALVAQRMFAEHGIKTFVPMERREVVVKGNKTKSSIVPILRNLIFVNTTLPVIIDIKSQYQYLWYLTKKEDNKIVPLVVPDEQMHRFIAFISDRMDQVDYLDPDTIDLKKGEKVIIQSGPFTGQEAVLIKVTGRRCKQVVVSINDVLVVAVKSAFNDFIIEKVK